MVCFLAKVTVMQRLVELIWSISFLGLILASGGRPVVAQFPKGNPKNLGVDSIKTKERQLYGFMLGRRADGTINCAVERSWLAKTYPQFLIEYDTTVQASLQELKQLRIDRLKAWINERQKEEHIRLRLYLESELSRLKAYQPDLERAEFVMLEIAPNNLVRLTVAKPEQRQIAAVAYQRNLKDVTVTPAAILDRRLKELGVDSKLAAFDLSEKLPKLARESEVQWAIRQALVEHEVLESVELQGQGSLLLGANGGADPLALLEHVQRGAGLDLLLKDLSKKLRLDLGASTDQTENSQWRQTAMATAEKKDARGVLVLRLESNILVANAKVTATFLARTADGKWLDVYHAEHENDGSQASQQELDRIRQDPTVQRILPMIEALGGTEQIKHALRQGVATQLALSQARSKFHQFRGQYSRDILSAPPPEPQAR